MFGLFLALCTGRIDDDDRTFKVGRIEEGERGEDGRKEKEMCVKGAAAPAAVLWPFFSFLFRIQEWREAGLLCMQSIAISIDLKIIYYQCSRD